MSFIEEEIKRVEDRLAEIQPVLDEAEQLRAVLENLMRVASEAERDGSEGASSGRKNLSKAKRIEQISGYLDRHEGASRVEIARTFGLTPGRVSQLMPEVEAARKANKRKK